MKKNINKYWRLLVLFRKIAFMKLMTYRKDFFFWMLVSLMWTAFNFFFYGLFFAIQPSVAGWSRDEFFLFLGVFTIIDGFLWGYMYQNMRAYVYNIFSGGLTLWLTKPVDIQFVQMTHLSSENNLPRIFVGFFIVLRQVSVLQLQLTISQVLLFFASLAISIICIYLLWFFIATAAFYLEKAELLNSFFPELRQAWQVPGNIFTGSVGFVLHTIMPLGLFTTLPSTILTSSSSVNSVLYLFAYTIGLLIISRKVFLFSLKRYQAPLG